MSQQYLSGGLGGGKFPTKSGTSVVHHPQPVSPSEVVDINFRMKHQERFGGLESYSVPELEHDSCIGKEDAQKMFPDCQVPVDILMRQIHHPKGLLSRTRPVDNSTDLHSNPSVMTQQHKTILKTDMEAALMSIIPDEHLIQASYKFGDVGSVPYLEWSSIYPTTSNEVSSSPANPTMQPRTECFGIEERQEKEEIDIALGVGRNRPLKTAAAAHQSILDPLYEDLHARFKKKKGKDNSRTQKESKSGVLLPRPTSAKNQPLVTQPSQDPEAEISEYLVVSRNAAGFKTTVKEVDEYFQEQLFLSRCTCKVTEQDFLKVSEQLPEFHQSGIWILNHDLNPAGVDYLEDTHFTAERLAKGGFGTVSLCRDKVSGKTFIQKKVPKEKWRKAENIALMTLKGRPNICELLGMKQESDKNDITVSLFLEDAGMSLSNFVRMIRPDKMNQQEILAVAEQMFCGMVDLHRYGILHLDLKPDNICIQGSRRNFALKIIDLGSAKLSQEPIYFSGMTPEYLAPEVCTCFIAQQHGIMHLAEQLISSKADVAAGALVILFVIEGYDVLIRPITNGETSYIGKTDAEIKSLRAQLVVTHAYTPDLASCLISDDIEMNLRELLNGCLVGNPEKRFSSEQALQFIRDRKMRTNMCPQDSLLMTSSTAWLQLLCHQNQQMRVGVPTYQQTTQAGERMFGLSSKQDPHGSSNFPVRVSNRNKHREKSEPYPTHRRTSFSSVSEDPHTNVATHHLDATSVIPTTVNPETYPTTPETPNLPNFDAIF